MNVKNVNRLNLTLLTVLFSSIVLNWTPATDNVTASTSLQYEVSISSRDNIKTVADIEKNGIVVTPFTPNITSTTVNNLRKGRTYYFNIIVKDEAGNKAAHKSKSVLIPR